MRTLLFVIFFGCCLQQVIAQRIISGAITNDEGKPVAGANIAIAATYDGATSDENGLFSFGTFEKDSLNILVSATGYLTWGRTVPAGSDSVSLMVILEEVSQLETVVITAGSFVASDEKRGAQLSA